MAEIKVTPGQTEYQLWALETDAWRMHRFFTEEDDAIAYGEARLETGRWRGFRVVPMVSVVGSVAVSRSNRY
jgi:hypothetical protein